VTCYKRLQKNPSGMPCALRWVSLSSQSEREFLSLESRSKRGLDFLLANLSCLAEYLCVNCIYFLAELRLNRGEVEVRVNVNNDA
jgi:hypothetical protein